MNRVEFIIEIAGYFIIAIAYFCAGYKIGKREGKRETEKTETEVQHG